MIVSDGVRSTLSVKNMIFVLVMRIFLLILQRCYVFDFGKDVFVDVPRKGGIMFLFFCAKGVFVEVLLRKALYVCFGNSYIDVPCK